MRKNKKKWKEKEQKEKEKEKANEVKMKQATKDKLNKRRKSSEKITDADDPGTKEKADNSKGLEEAVKGGNGIKEED